MNVPKIGVKGLDAREIAHGRSVLLGDLLREERVRGVKVHVVVGQNPQRPHARASVLRAARQTMAARQPDKFAQPEIDIVFFNCVETRGKGFELHASNLTHTQTQNKKKKKETKKKKQLKT